jgi:putative DNA primase/helicase
VTGPEQQPAERPSAAWRRANRNIASPMPLLVSQLAGEPQACSHAHLRDADPLVRKLGFGAAALQYAALGLAVFPLVYCTKRPATPNGFKDATTDPAKITSQEWWGGNRFLGVGIATGAPSGGLFVLDLDWASVKDPTVEGGIAITDGAESLLDFLAEHALVLPQPVPYEDTPRYGFHMFQRSGGRPVRTRAGVLPGLDIRGDGGYVAAWPTRAVIKFDERPGDPGGRVERSYTWHGCPCQAPVAPAAFLDVLEQLPGGHSSGGGGGGGGGGGNGGQTGWTDPDIPALAVNGIPPGVVQRPVLRDVVWKLAAEGRSEAGIRDVWQQIVARTPLTRPEEPWTEYHFQLALKGAQEKAQERAMEDGQAAQAVPGWMLQGPAAVAVQAPVQGVVMKPQSVIDKKEGLLAAKAAQCVLDLGPLRYGIDNQLWAYERGVWVPGEDPGNDIVHARITWLLGNQFRQAHGTNIKEMIRARVGPLRCGPVPGLINFRNGLLAWQDESLPLPPHSPDVLSTIQLSVNWNPEARCPAFDAFLAGVLAPGDVPRMWEVIGYLLLSGNPLHRMFLLYGRGFNGKGVLLRVLIALLGEASVSSVSLHSLAEERFTRAGLVGRTANICGDIDATYIERTGLLKQLTGEDLITAEHKFRKPAQFTNWAVPVFSANEIPTSSDTSPGWRQRWEVFTFPNTFPHNPDLEPSLKQQSELEGIAVRAVVALRELMARRPPEFSRTAAGDAAKAEFIASQDPLHGWMAEGCWTMAGKWTDRREAYASYKAWADAGGHRPLGKTKFYALMRERYPETTQRGWIGYDGLILRPAGS